MGFALGVVVLLVGLIISWYVAGLGAVDPLPITVLVPGTEDPATAFAAVLADPAHAGRALPLDRLLGTVLARSEAPPPERQQKVRALGGRGK